MAKIRSKLLRTLLAALAISAAAAPVTPGLQAKLDYSGAIALWLRPNWAWGEGNHALYRGGYTMLGASVDGGRIMGATVKWAGGK